MSLRLVTIWFDGGSLGNPGKGYGSYEVQGGAELCHKVIRQEFGPTLSCNQAEYLSLIAALKWLRHHVIGESTRLEIFTDSTLVRNQVHGRWKCRVAHLKELKAEALSLLSPYQHWEINWRGRAANVERFGH